MIIGPYAKEQPTLKRLHDFIEEHGYKMRGPHHEIYISDPRRVPPERLKTITHRETLIYPNTQSTYMKPITVVFSAHGHENILATHKTTFETTKEVALTKRGDCIVAVKATTATADLPPEFKQVAKKERVKITITIEANELKEIVKARGSPQLTLTHPTDLVVRKNVSNRGRQSCQRLFKKTCGQTERR
jgi:hypothetical protein